LDSIRAGFLAGAAYWYRDTRWLPTVWLYISYGIALVAVLFLVRKWYEWWITEIAVTNRRVIFKKGLVKLHTNEMNLEVESVQVDQSILGRMFDFGTVKILGTGEGFETLRIIAAPIKLRNSIITGTEVTNHSNVRQ
jgi:uncharacterized membrane protein YdbT with pleckstrin-like domain